MIILIAILIFGASWYVQHKLKKKFRKYSQIPLQANFSGKDIAERMLQDNNIQGVQVTATEGRLTDHYNPADKTVNLSKDVYNGRNAAAVAIAAHECGHALQHAQAYEWLQLRSQMVPIVQAANRYLTWVLLAGILLIQFTLIPLAIAVGLFAITTLFSIVTLPVEFDASKRALAYIDQRGLVTPKEQNMAQDALNWAAMTYVVAALGSIATLLYYGALLFGLADD